MLRVVTYSNGRLSNPDVSKVSLIRNYHWIDAKSPSSGELQELRKRFGIAPVDLKYALDVNEKPRLMDRKGYTLLILSGVMCEGGEGSCSSFGVFLGKRFILTVHNERIKPLEEAGVEKELLTKSFKNGIPYVLFTILYQLFREFSSVLNMLDESLDDIEEDLVKRFKESDIRKIFSLKRTILYLRRSVLANRDVVSLLVSEKALNKDAKIFTELNIEFIQLADQIELYKDRVTSAIDIYMSMSSNKVNQTMKSFTIIAALLLLPMFITSFYGMNISLPMAGNPSAFWIIVGVVVVCILAMLGLFKAKKWL